MVPAVRGYRVKEGTFKNSRDTYHHHHHPLFNAAQGSDLTSIMPLHTLCTKAELIGLL